MEDHMPVRPLILVVAALALSGLALAGCNSVNATLDGQSAEPIQSAFFMEDDGYYGGNDGQVVIYLVSFADACTVYENYWDEFNEMNWFGNWDALEDLEDLWAENFPETFELTELVIRVDDPDDSVAGLDFKGVDWNDGLDDDDETKATFTRYKESLDEDFWEAFIFGGDTDDYLEYWVTDDGDMSVGGHTPNESIRGSFTTTLVDWDDGDDESEVTFRFNATRCDGAQDEYPYF
jgi:hypothetical protein